MEMTMERSSTDKRLDDLNEKVDRGFERVDADIRALRAESRTEFTAVRAEMKSESTALRAEMKAGFDSVNERFDSMNERFESINERFDSMNERFDSVNERFDSMNDSLSRRFEAMHRLLLQLCGGLFSAFVVAAAALIATQI